MRLFKLLIIAIIIGSIYFYAKQHSSTTTNWQHLSIAHGISLQFPEQPVSKSFQKNIPSLGKVNLTTFQSASDAHIFVVLIAGSLAKNIRNQNLSALGDSIHAINDTTGLTITHKQAFMFHSLPGIEYKATNQKGAILWCRTIKKDNQLISIIYGSNSAKLDSQLRDTFFNSLKL